MINVFCLILATSTPRFGNIRSMHLGKPPLRKDLKECVGETQIEVWKGEEPKQGTNDDMSPVKHSQQDSTQAQKCVNNDIHNPSSMPSVCAHNVGKECVDKNGMNIQSIPLFFLAIFLKMWHQLGYFPTYKSYSHDVKGQLSCTRAYMYHVILIVSITSSHI